MSCAVSMPASDFAYPSLESWEHVLQVIAALFFFFFLYMHTKTEECKVNDFSNECKYGLMSLLSIKNPTSFSELYKLQFCIAFASLKSKPVLTSCLGAQGWWNHYYFIASAMVHFTPCFSVANHQVLIGTNYGPSKTLQQEATGHQLKHFKRSIFPYNRKGSTALHDGLQM